MPCAPGTIRFHWDNSFSWFKSKTITYTVTVDRPAAGVDSGDDDDDDHDDAR